MKIRKEQKEKREDYYVTYHFANSYSFLANLSITYIIACPEDRVISDIEKEFRIWFERYPVPLMASAFDFEENLIDLPSRDDWSHYSGYQTLEGKLVCGWYHMKNSDIPDFCKTEQYQEKIYQNVSYIDSEELALKVNKKFRIRAIVVRLFVCMITIIIPLAWLIGGIFYQTIAFLSTAFAFIILLYKTLRLAGIIPKTNYEKQKAEKERKKNHYFYHCELNPDGFESLKTENFKKETRQYIKNEYDKIKDGNESN